MHDKDPPRPLVLHLSGDFPDPVDPNKTPVIKTLVELTADRFEHHVVSINRIPTTLGQICRALVGFGPLRGDGVEARSFEHGLALTYSAAGRGILHKTYLENLGEWLSEFLAQMTRRPDIIIAHKLTIEGIPVARTAARFGIPYALSIQGNTDAKILKYRPDLKPAFAEIWHYAAGVFPFTPWALRSVEERLGKRSTNTWLLPCPTQLDDCIAPRPGRNRFISAFHLRNHHVKNFDRVVRAFAGSEFAIDVVGGGTSDQVAACERIASKTDNVSLIGPRNQSELRPLMNDAIALLMPSRRESFGLVFIEALQSGCPIIYPRGAAVDGYFDDCPFAISVDASSVAAIRSAIKFAADNELELKRQLAEWQNDGAHLRFTRSHIAKVFGDGLEAVSRNEHSSMDQ